MPTEASQRTPIEDRRREEDLLQIEKLFSQCDQLWLKKAKGIYQQKQGLEAAVTRNILPALVTIHIPGGQGSGFFFSLNWLITNAHVSPTLEVLRSAHIQTIDSEHMSSLNNALVGQFIRPVTDQCPDVAVIHIDNGSKPCIPTLLPQGQAYGEDIYFCVDPAAAKHERIIFLTPHTKNPEESHLVFTCANGKEVQPGMSGTPILKARLLRVKKEAQWYFAVEGVLYANEHDNSKQVHAVKISHELQQIHKILIQQREHAIEGQLRALSLQSCESSTSRQTNGYEEEYCKGGTSRFFRPPPSVVLNPLYYKNIVPLDLSLLIPVNRKGAIKSIMQQVPKVSLATLQEDFIQLLTPLAEDPDPITFPSSGKPTNMYLGLHLRIDVEGTDPKILSIEDNIPYRGKINGKTLSSVFAKIKLINPPKKMSGIQLAALLLRSQITKHQGKCYCIVVCFPNASVKKNKNKNKNKKKKQNEQNQHVGTYEELFAENLDDLQFSPEKARLSLSTQLNTAKNTAKNTAGNSARYGY
jgi:hypothetical protein